MRRTRETVDAGIRLILPKPRPRSISEPPSPRLSERPRRGSGFSVHESEKLPQIVTRSPIPSQKDAASQEDTELCCHINQDKDASTEGNKTCFLSVPEKERLRRTYSNGSLSKISPGKESNITLLGTENAVQKRLIQRRGSQNQDSIPQAEDNEGTSLPINPRESKVEGIRKNKCRSQSESSLSVFLPNGFSSGDKAGSVLSPQLCPPIPPKSPRPRSRRSSSLFCNQSSKTNIELMATAELSGKFKTVGHCVVGVAVISRLNGKLQGEQNLEGEEYDIGYHETGRRGHLEMNARNVHSARRGETIGNINVVSSCQIPRAQ